MTKAKFGGRPVLVVEDEFLIALDLQRMLESLGMGQILFCRTPDEAEAMASDWTELCLAIVAARPTDSASVNLVDTLVATGIPVLVTLGEDSGRQQLGNRSSVITLVHPISDEELAAAIAEIGAECH